MTRADLFKRFNNIVETKRSPRFNKLLLQPLATIHNSIFMRMMNLLFYSGLSFHRDVETFFEERMTLILPGAHKDVYFYGAMVGSDAEIRLNKFLLASLGDGGIFFDAGACVGYYSLLASHLVGPRGEVHAFEPSPKVAPILRRNLRNKSNVTIVEKALSNTTGRAPFFEGSLWSITASSLLADWQPLRNAKAVDVEKTTLDEYCACVKTFPDIIKLDVEGTEDEVLMGSQKLLKEKGPLVVVEVFIPLLAKDRRSIELLMALDYEPCVIQEDGSLQTFEYSPLELYLNDLKARHRMIRHNTVDYQNLVFRKSNSR